MEADFSGYATKVGLKCSDGRTIMPDAFKHQDKMRVPLVWQHSHNDPENVLGHVLLENRNDGVYAYAFFNDTAKAVHAKALVEHKDITMMSIWANQLIQRSKRVIHGAIREVSLVMAGANPGALIENVTIRHSDGMEEDLDDEVIIYSGVPLVHGDEDEEEEDDDDDDQEKESEKSEDKEEDDDLNHADDDEDETLEDVYESMSDKQKDVLHYMVGQALEQAEEDKAEHSNTKDNNEEGSTNMTRNVFEKEATKATLSHQDIEGIVADATKNGSLKDAVEAYALAHGIEEIDVLFPEARNISDVPEFLKRRTEWVSALLAATRKSPFSRIKTISADLTFDEARAKGYIKGNMKREEFFAVTKRITTPTTIYKKQQLDRDDIIDITDFDVVTWLKGEMRLMLDEEIARAILIGDGRDVSHVDKVNEGNIRPIAKDNELYTTTVNVNIDDANSSIQEVVDAIVSHRRYYRGTGLPVMYTTETYISKFLLLKDSLGRRIYKTLDEVAAELRVSGIVPVEVMEDEPDIVAVLVNPVDYVVGADKGGQVSMFDDFDIDYNQQKYLIETRISGALVKLKSALVVMKVAGAAALVIPTPPSYSSVTGLYTITNTAGVVYKDQDNNVVNAGGSPYEVPYGETVTITATPASSSYYFASSEGNVWKFTNTTVEVPDADA